MFINRPKYLSLSDIQMCIFFFLGSGTFLQKEQEACHYNTNCEYMYDLGTYFKLSISDPYFVAYHTLIL